MPSLSTVATTPLARRTALLLTSMATGGMTVYLSSHFVFKTMPCPVLGASMAPALSPSYAATGQYDTVLVSPWSLRRRDASGSSGSSNSVRMWSLWPFRPWFHDIRRGDVVVLRKPHNPEEKSIKRVVGLPGDRIVRRRRTLEVNKRLAKKYGFDAVPREVVVPQGHIWVEGDNWRDTFDSNDFGPVSINLVTGRASRVVWPYSRQGAIPERSSKHHGKTTVHKRLEHDYGDEDAWKEFNNYR